MDVLWPWVLAMVLVIILAAVFLSKNRTPALRKMEIPRTVPDAEFATEIAPKPPKKKRESLPNHYDIDRLVLAIKDPKWVYAYWEISSVKFENFIHRYGNEAWENSRPVLRLYDENGKVFQEICLDPWADNWFIEVGQANKTLYAELGRVLAHGEFFPLLISNRVTTPADTVSNQVDEEWMYIEGIYQYMGQAGFGLSSAMMMEKNPEK